MFKQILSTALVAGFVAGMFMSVIQAGWVIPLIVRGETYEFCTPNLECPPGDALTKATPVKRLVYTTLFNIVSGIAFAFFLAAGFVMRGGSIGGIRGLAWGAAGFAAFSLAPSFGLPPALPGAARAPLMESQICWLGVVAASTIGLALLFFAKEWGIKALGIVIIALPHIIGAPLVVGDNASPIDLMQEFVVASLVTTGLFWLALGAISGSIYHRLYLFSPQSDLYYRK